MERIKQEMKIHGKSLKIVYILMLFYSIYDIMNSTSAGNISEDRSSVYVFLFAIVFYMCIAVISKRYISINYLLGAMFLFDIYYLIDIWLIKRNGGWSSIVYFGLSTWWILIIIFFENQLDKNINNLKSIQNFVRIMFIIYSIAIIYGASNIKNTYSVEYARVGYIYHILAMLPMILIDRNEFLKKIFLMISIGLTIFSFKRGAIIILPAMLILYFITENKVGEKKNNILRMIMILIAIILAWLVIDNYSGGYLSSRFSESELSDGSGRSEIWTIALSNVGQRNLLQMIFGIKGSNEKTLWTGIHNEWISYLNANGILGMIFFGIVVICIIRQTIYLLKKKSCLAPSAVALCIYILGVCWVSGFYHVHSTFYVMLFLGCIQSLKKYSDVDIRKRIGE